MFEVAKNFSISQNINDIAGDEDVIMLDECNDDSLDEDMCPPQLSSSASTLNITDRNLPASDFVRSKSTSAIDSTSSYNHRTNCQPSITLSSLKSTNKNTFKKTQITEDIEQEEINNQKYSKNKKFDWTYESTKALIDSYANYYQESDSTSFPKNFWENIENDLISQRFNVNKNMCKTKWTALETTYRACKDKTGRAPDRFEFFEAIEEIIGHRPTNSSKYTAGSLSKKSTSNDNFDSVDVTLNVTKGSNKKEKNSTQGKKNYKRKQAEEDDPKKERDEKKMKLEERKLEIEERKIALEFSLEIVD